MTIHLRGLTIATCAIADFGPVVTVATAVDSVTATRSTLSKNAAETVVLGSHAREGNGGRSCLGCEAWQVEENYTLWALPLGRGVTSMRRNWGTYFRVERRVEEERDLATTTGPCSAPPVAAHERATFSSHRMNAARG